jgi:small subunit ribosomal protein S6
MNIECGQDVLDELSSAFRYNDAVIRSAIFSCNEAVTGDSPIMKAEKSDHRSDRRDTRTEEAASDSQRTDEGQRSPSADSSDNDDDTSFVDDADDAPSEEVVEEEK